jgi:hypothetical protein
MVGNAETQAGVCLSKLDPAFRRVPDGNARSRLDCSSEERPGNTMQGKREAAAGPKARQAQYVVCLEFGLTGDGNLHWGERQRGVLGPSEEESKSQLNPFTDPSATSRSLACPRVFLSLSFPCRPVPYCAMAGRRNRNFPSSLSNICLREAQANAELHSS